ncbi:MAG TPA: hypothetical protein PKL37_10400 [Panacibacter sp.]|nr:hypothetical protein [Panacibacter sp.]
MTRWKFVLGFSLCFSLFFTACTKQTDVLRLPELNEYYPLQIGRVFVYRLDSTVIPYNGNNLEIHSYHARDSIADTIRDNANRLSYRVYRFVTDTLENGPWVTTGTYIITPTGNSVEVVDDNNLRIIKLVKPLSNGFSWNGNSYIDASTAGGPFQYMYGWNFQYQNVAQPFNVLYGTFNNTVTVLQIDDTSPPGPFDPSQYQQRNYSIEVYAQNIGLVYKEFLHTVWQVTPPPPGYDNGTYGIKLSLIDYR